MAEAQCELGIDANAILFRPHRFGYSDRLHGRSHLSRRLIAIRQALTRSDVVHLYFGTSLFTLNRLPDHAVHGPVGWTRRALSRFFWMRDLPLLKRLGKTVAITFLGDDVRQVDRTRESRARSHLHGDHGDVLALSDARKRRLVQCADTHADLIYATNPDLLAVLPARTRFLPYLVSGIEAPRRACYAARPFTVAHAPSNTVVKGTAEVEEAIRRLRSDAFPVRLDLITDTSHAQALERIARADIFIDQLRVGWYGVAAAEALARGCVVLGYVDESDRSRIPDDMNRTLPIMPVSNAEDIVSAIRRLRSLPADDLAGLSGAGAAWADRWHGRDHVAGGVIEDYCRARFDG